jgi:hypothetical protein
MQVADDQHIDYLNRGLNSWSKLLVMMKKCKSSEFLSDPLISGQMVLKLLLVKRAFRFSLSCLIFLGSWTVEAAPDFKIRYNQKFPCLEIMDSKAVKITDVTEGAKGDTVTSGKASLNISFIKNADGLPEVTLREAKSPLSEMEIEAFGLSVGLKPEGTVLVRFGADNKPKFEMDRTGGSRFLMADLGNLDTAAGKELATDATAPAGPSKVLLRFRERLAAWKAGIGKGGWSNRPGKILDCGSDALVTYTALPERKLLDGEAIQIGALVKVGPKDAVSFQSGPGIYHTAMPGTQFTVAPLEVGQRDVKVTLVQGTLLTDVLVPLSAPRMAVLGVGNGMVVQASDGLFQISKSVPAEVNLIVAKGAIRLVEEAGAAQVGQVKAGNMMQWPAERVGKKTPEGALELATLAKMDDNARNSILIDMVEDAMTSSAEDVEEIIQTACDAERRLARKVAMEAVELRPDLHGLITKASGIADLPVPLNLESDVEKFVKKAAPWVKGQPSPMSSAGKVLKVEGKVTYANGLAVTRSMILKVGEVVKTGGDGRVLFVAAPGVIAEIQPGSEVRLVEMRGKFSDGTLLESKTVLDASQGQAFVSIAQGLGDKVEAEVRNPQGVAQAKSTSKTTGVPKL